jgi:hypothetical protein
MLVYNFAEFSSTPENPVEIAENSARAENYVGIA